MIQPMIDLAISRVMANAPKVEQAVQTYIRESGKIKIGDIEKIWTEIAIQLELLIIERKKVYSEEFDMTNFPKTSDSQVVDRLAEYIYVYDKVTSDESMETALLNGDLKGLLTSEDELSALYSFEY